MASGLTAQLRISTEEELHAKLVEAKEELFNLRFQGATGQLESHGRHPKYGKVLRRTKKYKAHDATNACGVGDRVLLMETRPLSATKRWRVAEILEKAK